MANLCLPRSNREKLSNALKSGDISIAKLYAMSDAERNLIFKQYVGSDFASVVNAKFEQAMISKQKTALSNWIKRTLSQNEPVRRNMLKRVERIEKILTPDEERGFLQDLAGQKLGISVTEEEAATILKLKNSIDELKAKVPENAPLRSEERLAYGYALDDFKQYVGNLKLEADTISFTERFKPTNYGKNIVDVAGVTKSLVATLDDSFIGRQGWKVLLDGKYGIWATTALESIKNFGKELVAKSGGFFKTRDDAIMRSIRADVFSRPNALNGKYMAAKNGYGLGVITEEVFPSNFPERIPLLGRLFKASETAFNGSAIRMRADLADAAIAAAEQNGVDMLDPKQASAFGRLISAKTGRGEIGTLATQKWVNPVFFSIRFLKSNFDTLTAHLFDKTLTPEAKKEAVKSTLRIVESIGAMLVVAKILDPDSVDFDPRKGRMGKIRVMGHDIDITGGMGGMVTFASRILPTYHEGEWGFWTFSQATKKWTKTTGAFGEKTALDTFEQFFEGKLSPLAGAFRDVWRGQNFQGEKPTFVNTSIGLITPISADMLIDELKKGNDDILLAMMAEVMGFSVSDTSMRGFGVRWEKLKEKKGDVILNQTLKQVTEQFNKRAESYESSPRFQRMNTEEKNKELDRIRKEVTDNILNRFGI